jgi:peptidyl-prolyl cis-trans isomerase
VDKQELFQGLRQAIKLLKENEEAVFFFPSEIAFGYHGDKEKIGVNKPIRAQVHILKITPAPPPPPSTSESVGLIKCDFE